MPDGSSGTRQQPEEQPRKPASVISAISMQARAIAEWVKKHWPMLAKALRVVAIIFFASIAIVGFRGAGFSEHNLFVGNVVAHLVALMSGVVSFLWSAIEATRKEPIAKRAFWIVGALCLLAAFEQAWRDEHRNTQNVIEQRATADGKLNTCQSNLSAQTQEAVFYKEQVQLQQATINTGQSTVNRCLDYLLKTTSPEPLSIATRVTTSTAFKYKDASGRENPIEILVATPSRDMPHLRVLVECDQPFAPVDEKLTLPDAPGAAGIELGIGLDWVNSRALKLTSQSRWNVDEPLVVMVAGYSVRHCNIQALK